MKRLMKRSSFGRRTAVTLVTVPLLAGGAFLSPNAVRAEQNTELMEQRLMQMEEQMRLLRQELDRVRKDSDKPARRIEALEERVYVTEVREKTDMVAFRGGWAYVTDNTRSGQVFTDLFNLGSVKADPRNGWYVGTQIEHQLSDDFYGLWDETRIFGEIMFEYAQWISGNAKNSARVVPVATSLLVPPPTPVGLKAVEASQGVTLSQFTLSASPKIKFLKGSTVQPWLIPAGLDIHVVSPPSNAGTVLQTGIQFAAGVDWNVWCDSIFLGADVRYHLASKVDGVDVNHLTAGGYLGFAF